MSSWKDSWWTVVLIFMVFGYFGITIDRMLKEITSRLDAIKKQLELVNENLRR